MFRYFNLRGKNDATYPRLAMRFSADEIQAQTRTFSLSNQIINVNGAVGAPAYKDQAASFLPGQDIHFYAIAGASVSPSGVSSLRAPSVGPDLSGSYFAGYDSWCYLTTIKVTADGLLYVAVRDAEVTFQCASYYPIMLVDPSSIVPTPNAATLGQSLVWEAIDVAPCIPELAQQFRMFVDAQIVPSGGHCSSALLLNLAIPTGNPDECCAVVSCFGFFEGPDSAVAQNYVETLPNPSRLADRQDFYYKWLDIAGAAYIYKRYFSIYMRGYTVPSA